MLVEKLALQADVSEDWLWHLAATASVRYKVYEIPKKTGGSRTIEHPSRDLKSVQRWLTREVTSLLPVHECATAYRTGSSIRKNALVHSGSRYTVRFDFRSFFPSFSDIRIRRFLQLQVERNSLELLGNDIGFFVSCVTRKNHLTIGAPSSPMLSNVMLYEFDMRMNDFCCAENLRYTRYADDIFVSSNEKNKLQDVSAFISESKRGISYLSLRLNRKKTIHLSKKHSRRITGLVLSTEGRVSLGRARKREIKSLIHSYQNSRLMPDEVARLRGLVAFSMDAEPEFVERLLLKYGVDTINQLLGR